MTIPSTAIGAALLLALVMPGIVVAAVRTRLRGPVPEDRDVGVRVLRAMAVSLVLDSIYALAVGPHLYTLTHEVDGKGKRLSPLLHIREVGGWTLLLAFVIPSLLSWFWNGFVVGTDADGGKYIRRRHGYHPTPSAWDWATSQLTACFVRIRLPDGRFVGGWGGREMFTSTHPEPRDIFLDRQWYLAADGQFTSPVPGGIGLYVAVQEGSVVDWILTPSQVAKLEADAVELESRRAERRRRPWLKRATSLVRRQVSVWKR